MFRHLIYNALIAGALVFLMFRPYMPGSYDELAATISFMTQIGSFAGLLLVPLGIVWLLSRPGKPTAENNNKRFRIAALIVLAIVAVLVSIIPLSQNNASLALLFLVMSVAALARSWMAIKESPPTNPPPLAAPLYLIIIPVIAVTARLLFIEKAANYSRDLAIRNSAALIQGIENHFERFGQYPPSLQALHSDISPGVVGIRQYCYEPNGDAYNLYFRHFPQDLAAEEIVMYNKLDEHGFSAHLLDILEYTGDALTMRRGDQDRLLLSTPHWISISFD